MEKRHSTSTRLCVAAILVVAFFTLTDARRHVKFPETPVTKYLQVSSQVNVHPLDIQSYGELYDESLAPLISPPLWDFSPSANAPSPLPPSESPLQGPLPSPPPLTGFMDPPPSPLPNYLPTPPSTGFMIPPPLQAVPSPPSSTGFMIPPPLQLVPGPPKLPDLHPPLAPGPPKQPDIHPPPAPAAVASPPPTHKWPMFAVWCVAKPTMPDPIVQQAMDYACGSGADCKNIQPNGPCFQPNTMFAHASYAFNSYWQSSKVGGGTCDFGGTAMLVTTDPSSDNCEFIS